MERLLSMNEYLDKNPNATLKDYVDYTENIRNASITKKNTIEDNFNNWLKEQEGKWFFINFNDSSYLLCQYTGQDMYDNRALYVDNSNVNRVVENILGLHQRNLL